MSVRALPPDHCDQPINIQLAYLKYSWYLIIDNGVTQWLSQALEAKVIRARLWYSTQTAGQTLRNYYSLHMETSLATLYPSRHFFLWVRSIIKWRARETLKPSKSLHVTPTPSLTTEDTCWCYGLSNTLCNYTVNGRWMSGWAHDKLAVYVRPVAYNASMDSIC
jgi:hypothetical protein